jgi:hypothetical protein
LKKSEAIIIYSDLEFYRIININSTNMKKSIVLILATVFIGLSSVAQQPDKQETKESTEKKERNFGIKFNGFVKNDFIFDSRQVVSAREGHFLLYPLNESLDEDGKDINARGSFNYLSIQSRLTGRISGPDAFGAKTSGLIEGAFFGQTNPDINGFRLRHAFIKLNWTSTELLMGQFWHLMFNTACYPGTVSFNTGAPFQFFSRNPQIRLSQKAGPITFSGALATQLDFASPGGSSSLRNALLPDLGGQISYSNDMILVGLTAGYKQLVPRLVTENNYKTKAKVRGVSGQAFFKLATKPITAKAEITYYQNGYDGLFIGGYAVQSITDPARDYRDYTTLNVLNFWTEVHTNGKKIQGGLFIGYSHNLGSNKEIEEISMITTYSRGYSIGYIFRVAPRLIINRGKLRFAVETEHTGAAYGDSVNNKGVPQNTKLVVNHRLLVATYYFF